MHGINFGLGALGRGSILSAVTPWWLADGVSPSACIAAYQAKGVASQAASYSNLANPGTYNLQLGVAPSWGATNGWTFSGSQWLNTGIVPSGNQDWSALIGFSGLTGSASCRIFGLTELISGSFKSFTIVPNDGYSGRSFANVSIVTTYSDGSLNSGIAAFAGLTAFVNGSSYLSLSSVPHVVFTKSLYIGSVHYCEPGFETAANGVNCKIQAFCIYNTTLSSAQVLAITNAMNAL